MGYKWFGYYIDDDPKNDRRDKYYEGYKKGYRYDGDGYYSSLTGGSDLYWDAVEGRYMHTM